MSGLSDTIAYYNSLIAECERRIEEYEDDFRIISDCEEATIKLLAVAKNTVYLTECLDNSIKKYTEHIEYLKGLPQITDFVRIDNLTEPAEFRSAMDDFVDATEQNCRYMDYLKADISKKVQAEQGSISAYRSLINSMQQTPGFGS